MGSQNAARAREPDARAARVLNQDQAFGFLNDQATGGDNPGLKRLPAKEFR
jgi:hypothetical protein